MDLDYALAREWLETNGIGGYASSTLVGLNTRRYHGLLVAATQPPVGRMVLLSKLEETLIVDGRRYELAANRYPGVIHPQGYVYLKEYRSPTFLYAADGWELEKSIYMVQGENTTVIRYAFRAALPATLELRALLAYRDYHSSSQANGFIDPALGIAPELVKLQPYDGVPPLYVWHDEAQVRSAGDWYRNFEYDRERERGLDYREDLFHPFDLVFDLGEQSAAGGDGIDGAGGPTEIGQRQAVRSHTLYEAADQFIVAAGRAEHRNRRLSLVQRLGPRHDDRAARA